MLMASVVDITVRKQMEETLERRVHERTYELERRRQVSDGLFNVLAMINAKRPLEEILDSILRQAMRVLAVAGCAIHRRTIPENQLIPQVSRGLSNPNTLFVNNKLRALEPTMLKRIFSEREILCFANLSLASPHQSTVLAEPDDKLVANRLLSALIAPVIVRRDVYGVLSLFHREAHEFNDDEIGLAWILSEQVALAIENARLRTELEEAAVTAERSRIAHDLHDSVTQTLFSASIIADILPRLWERRPEEGERRLQELRELTRGALAEMRTLLLELRPNTLSTTVLSELIQQLGAAFIGRSRIPLQLVIGDELMLEKTCELPDDVRIAFYRIAQEALNNVAKHANATEASLALSCKDQRLKMLITDNGVGFSPQTVKGNHLGLNIMRERAHDIDAQLQIVSVPNEVDTRGETHANEATTSGTTVCVCWRSRLAENERCNDDLCNIAPTPLLTKE